MAGRPTKYTKEISGEICKRLIDGESLRSICESDGIPTRATVINWAMDKTHPFFDQYARAREIQAELMAEEIFDICDDGRNDWTTRKVGDSEIDVVDHEHIQRSRLRVDTRKWYLSKVLPKFRDKQELNVTGELEVSVKRKRFDGSD